MHIRDMTEWTCPSCQRTLPMGWRRVSSTHHGGKTVCAACYMRARRSAARPKTRHCVACGHNFTTSRADAHYCSGLCRQRARRRRATAPATPP